LFTIFSKQLVAGSPATPVQTGWARSSPGKKPISKCRLCLGKVFLMLAIFGALINPIFTNTSKQPLRSNSRLHAIFSYVVFQFFFKNLSSNRQSTDGSLRIDWG
jgi:hypothetical protein